jgi:hypothetical protein
MKRHSPRIYLLRWRGRVYYGWNPVHLAIRFLLGRHG